MDLRPYVPGDRNRCLSIFESNTPEYFRESERDPFSTFLDNAPGPYFVMEHEGALVGCGGYRLQSDAVEAQLDWGMIHAEMQKLGLGRFLLMFRLREIGKLGNISSVVAQAPQASASFFERQGFHRTGAAGRGSSTIETRIPLVKKLSVCQ